MKELVKHLWQTNREEILKMSIAHCHTKNVHSIVLLNSPGKTIRLFIALPGNELYKNYTIQEKQKFSIALHPHHCDITLHVVKGSLINWTAQETNDNVYSFICDKYKYQSKINNGDIKFELLHKQKLNVKIIERVDYGQSLFLEAHQIHTIYTCKDELTAWFVFEGQEHEEYENVCYTNTDLNSIDYSDLYQPISEEEIEKLLKQINLL